MNETNLTTNEIAQMITAGIAMVAGLYLSFWLIIGIVQYTQQPSTLGSHITKTIAQHKAK